tara:strand:+ start:205 stop:1164 length:960 start_codon:yes stop_codon:yes gene_type:complete
MRAELPDTHTVAGKNSAISQITGLTRQQTYHELKKAWQDKIREAYSKLSIPDPPTNSQPSTESLKESMGQLVETIYQTQNNLKKYYGNMLKEEKQKHASELDTEKQIYEANLKERDRIFGEATRTLRTEHERELKNLQNQLKKFQDEHIQNSKHSTSPDTPYFVYVTDKDSNTVYFFQALDDVILLRAFKLKKTSEEGLEVNTPTQVKIYKLKALYLHSTTHPAAYFEFVSTDQEVVTLKVQDQLEKKDLAAWLISHSTLIHLSPGFIKEFEHLKSHKIELRANIPIWFHQHCSHLLNTATQAPPRPARREYTVRVPKL